MVSPAPSPRSDTRRSLAGAVVVRPFTLDDAPALLALIVRNRARFDKAGLNHLPQRTSDVQDWITPRASSTERMVGVFEHGACVGFVGVLSVRVGTMAAPGLGIWYGLDEEAGGRGLATEGVRQALHRYAFPAAGEPTPGNGAMLPDLTMVHCRLTNRRSARLAVRLGMVRDPSIDYVRHNGGRSAPTMIGFSMPTAQWQRGTLVGLAAARRSPASPSATVEAVAAPIVPTATRVHRSSRPR